MLQRAGWVITPPTHSPQGPSFTEGRGVAFVVRCRTSSITRALRCRITLRYAVSSSGACALAADPRKKKSLFGKLGHIPGAFYKKKFYNAMHASGNEQNHK